MPAILIALDFPNEAVEEQAEHTIFITGQAVGADVVLSGVDTVDLGKGIVLRVVHNRGHNPQCSSGCGAADSGRRCRCLLLPYRRSARQELSGIKTLSNSAQLLYNIPWWLATSQVRRRKSYASNRLPGLAAPPR
jgi:hypothetical protein